jgi:hypothetical protein
MKIAEEGIIILSRLRITLFKEIFLIWKIFIKSSFNMLLLNLSVCACACACVFFTVKCFLILNKLVTLIWLICKKQNESVKNKDVPCVI